MNIKKIIFFVLYALCFFSAGKKGAAVEIVGALFFLTIWLNLPVKKYRVEFYWPMQERGFLCHPFFKAHLAAYLWRAKYGPHTAKVIKGAVS